MSLSATLADFLAFFVAFAIGFEAVLEAVSSARISFKCCSCQNNNNNLSYTAPLKKKHNLGYRHFEYYKHKCLKKKSKRDACCLYECSWVFPSL